MAANLVRYFRLNCATLRTQIHEIKCVTFAATYSYLLTNLVANFHDKFHQTSLIHPTSISQERCGVVTWLVCIFSLETAESNHRGQFIIFGYLRLIIGKSRLPNICRLNERTETNRHGAV